MTDLEHLEYDRERGIVHVPIDTFMNMVGELLCARSLLAKAPAPDRPAAQGRGSSETRCPSVFSGSACALFVGHFGHHHNATGMVIWDRA